MNRNTHGFTIVQPTVAIDVNCVSCFQQAIFPMSFFITGTVLGDHPTRKLASHASGKVHQYCEKYMSSKTDVPRKVKRTVVDMLRTSVDTKKQQENERNRQYVRDLAKILYFIVHQRSSINGFGAIARFYY